MAKRPPRAAQVRTDARRELDWQRDQIMPQLRGEKPGQRRLGAMLPHGKASYVDGDLTEIPPGLLIPSLVEVDLGLDPTRPIRRLRIEVRRGVPMCTDLRLAARPAGRGIRASDLEAIDLTGWVVDVLTECAWRYDHDGVQVSAAGSAEARRAVERALRQARNQVTPELLEQVADVYRANIKTAPTQAVADVLGKSQRTAARYIDEAREAGLLPPTTQGKPRA